LNWIHLHSAYSLVRCQRLLFAAAGLRRNLIPHANRDLYLAVNNRAIAVNAKCEPAYKPF
jgi:hypothetical protein